MVVKTVMPDMINEFSLDMNDYQLYIKKANTAIKQIAVYPMLKRDKYFYKKQLFKKFKLDKKNLYLSSDYPQNQDDIEIIRNVLKIDKKIFFVINKKEVFHSLIKEFAQRFIYYDISDLELAFSTDIHIFLWNKFLREILHKNIKVFNAAHPIEYNKINYMNMDIRQIWGLKKLKFFFGKKAEYIITRYDLQFHSYSECLNIKEIEQLSQTFYINYFYLLIKFSVNNRHFLDRTYQLAYMHYVFDRMNIQNDQYPITKNKRYILNVKDKIF